MDPAALGLCSQIDLDLEVDRAAVAKGAQPQAPAGDTLLPASLTSGCRPKEVR